MEDRTIADPDPLPSRPSIVIVGSGNVATHLALSLDKVARVCQVCSRHIDHAAALAARLRHCAPIDEPGYVNRKADYCIIAVSDDAIAPLAEQMPRIEGIAAHTSGSVPIGALAPVAERIGVFYPLQTFSKDAQVDVANAPFFIEANCESACAELEALACTISASVRRADSRQRALLHLAAVFACNFPNHLWSIADSLLRSGGYDITVMRPLLEATLAKAMAMPPAQAQTGPAARGDVNVMRRHMAALGERERQIYSLLSASIMGQEPPTPNTPL